MTYLIFQSSPWLLIVVLTIVLSLCIRLPYRWRRTAKGLARNMDAFNAVQTGILTLASFVLGLSFSQAQGRYDDRRALVTKEANAIGTTWLRADQLDGPHRERFRTTLVDYTSTRLHAYEGRRDASMSQESFVQSAAERSDRDQQQMWAIVSQAINAHPTNLGLSLLTETLTDTIDVSAEQFQALTTHIPTAVVVLMLVLIMLGALSLGVRFAADGSRPATLSALYVVAMVVVVTMMVDYDRPQNGFVRVNLNPIRLQLSSMEAPR